MIAYAQNGHSDKFGIPRQSREESPILTRIVFEPEYRIPEALRGIEGFSHLWLIWGFSEVQRTDVPCTKDGLSWSPTVRPPKLGGNKRMGVFATRSPFRPNPIGLSSVRLIEVRRTDVRCTKDVRREERTKGESVPESTWQEICYILSQDPRPAYQDDPEREYKMDYAGYRITFTVKETTVTVKKIEKI